MSQRTIQIIVIASSIILFSVLYFGFDNKPSNRSEVDKTRALKAEGTTDTDKIIDAAKAAISKDELILITELEAALPLQLTDSLRAETYKEISREWNKLQQFTVGGIYAKKVAESLKTETAWSIAGTTFGIAMKNEQNSENRQFAVDEATNAFQKALEINPEETQHKINLALTYVETAQPMQGIMMLRQLSEEKPENTAVLMALGQLSIRSGQYDKAVERYQQVIELEPKNLKGYYALGQVYQAIGKKEEAINSYQKCLTLSNDASLRSDIEQVIKKLKSN